MSEDYYLSPGAHDTPEDGRCAMEWVAHIAGLEHSDKPACVSMVMRSVMINLNDGLSDEYRQRLRPYLTRCIGTAGDGLDPMRYALVENMQKAVKERLHPVSGRLPGHLDCCADLFFGPKGYLEQLLPLEPWTIQEVDARVAQLREERQYMTRLVTYTPLSVTALIEQTEPAVA